MIDDSRRVRAADVAHLSLTFDHRVVDGAVCAAFANAVIRQLQNPPPCSCRPNFEPKRGCIGQDSPS